MRISPEDLALVQGARREVRALADRLQWSVKSAQGVLVREKLIETVAELEQSVAEYDHFLLSRGQLSNGQRGVHTQQPTTGRRSGVTHERA